MVILVLHTDINIIKGGVLGWGIVHGKGVELYIPKTAPKKPLVFIPHVEF